jgi:ABC-type iron transport system FetAB permease component
MSSPLAALAIETSATLSWANVLIGLLFILFDAVLSLILGLGIGASLIVAAARCVLQLSVMGLVLDKAFASQNGWSVVGIARRPVIRWR